jgi:hypothetical protein
MGSIQVCAFLETGQANGTPRPMSSYRVFMQILAGMSW